ncbi:glutathione S-transferase family protein [Sinimarinibacterium sp. CAU 1509]|uniref:glutathione S-transferase family protein n=1 Tax=Sinimarinibacterium sp. CAU 1509 TaxID=2562283 RepID=UPI0010AC47CC|nr:glutathione S-transferase family protein [Sinimarinibacterium sp. CAU 1509]TJY59945.1 glutathione S-transferase family protein [Sinimarinibacterium sp. CAU 1509]
MYTLYGMSGSGNCYKPALLMRQLGIAYRWVEVDLIHGATRTPEFLAKNPNGKVPLLELEDGRLLAESNAMLCYLADGSPLLPSERWQRAQVMQWLFFEQYSHEPAIATVRFWVHYLGKGEALRDRIRETRPKGYAALGVMEQQLGKTAFLAGNDYTIADIALYAYTHVAHQGGYQLSEFPQIEAWLRRVERQPGFIAMQS